MFFSSEKQLLSWTHLLNKAPQGTKILIYSIWNKILKIWDTHFELIQIEVKIISNFFYHKKLEVLEKVEKEQQKPRPKLNKNKD